MVFVHARAEYNDPMNSKYTIGLIALALIGGTAFYINSRNTQPVIQPPSGNDAHADWKTYTNADFGFAIQYPPTLTPEFTFTGYYAISSLWRSGALNGNTGQGIISIPVFKTKSEDSFPRYFTAEMRIGASSSTDDLKHCYDNDQSYRGDALPNVTLGGTEFKQFDIANAGMLQYMEGKSYRIIRNGLCFAIDAIKTGSSYRDDPTSSKTISQETLDSYYNQLGDIVKTFTFTN